MKQIKNKDQKIKMVEMNDIQKKFVGHCLLKVAYVESKATKKKSRALSQGMEHSRVN